MKCITNFFKVAKYEFLKILKDQNLLMVFLIAPLAYPALYGSIYVNKIEVDVPITVRDDDNSSFSRGLIREIDAHQSIRVAGHVFNQEEAETRMAQQKAFAALVIPKGFAENIKAGKKTEVSVILSPGRLLVLGDVGMPISQIVSVYSGKITASVLAAKGVPIFNNKDLAQPIKMDFQYMFNPYLSYGDLILPAIMAIVICQLVLISVASATAKEWSLNKWRDLFSISTNTPMILLAKLMIYVVTFIFVGLFIKNVLGVLFDIRLVGTGFDLLVITILGIISAASFGLFIGTFFHHRITAFVVLGFSTYPLFMISGYAWPASQLPDLVRWFSYTIPMTPFLNSVMLMTQMGNGLSGMETQILNMLILIVLYLSLAALRYERMKKQSDEPYPKGIISYLRKLPR